MENVKISTEKMFEKRKDHQTDDDNITRSPERNAQTMTRSAQRR